MKYNMPPLSCLPAFEAAARHRSFTKAAEELSVTQAAVSFQVRNLEKALSVKLFIRHHRSLELTAKGRSLMLVVQTVFTVLTEEKALITGVTPDSSVTITAPVSFCGKWLVPRLHRLYTSVANAKLRIDANDTIVDLEDQNVQLSIRYCANPPVGLAAEKLLDDVIFPACSPKFSQTLGPPNTLTNLGSAAFLSDQMTDFTWEDWFEAAGLPRNAAATGIDFSHTANAIDAAIAGQGLALGRLSLVADDLASGRLVRPFPQTCHTSYAYYIIRGGRDNANSRIDAVIEWLHTEAAATINSLGNISDA